MRITVCELDEGGWNDGPEVRVEVFSNELHDFAAVRAEMSPSQAATMDRYSRKASDWEILLPEYGYRYGEEWTFPLA